MLHGEQRFDYRAPVVVGDRLTFRPRVAGVSEKKGGAMTLVVVETAVTNQNGVHVADVSRTSSSATRGRHDQTLNHRVGARIIHKEFPPITRHKLALYCGASGDHNPIHVDWILPSPRDFPTCSRTACWSWPISARH